MRGFVIVGGGTAGWLTALFLARHFRESPVTVVESARIGTIGVGEGSTGLLTSVVRDPFYGIDEACFLRETRATLKLGIVHRDWRRRGYTYLGPIDNPSGFAPALAPGGFPLLQAWAAARGIPVADAHLNGRLMTAGRSPVLLRDDQAETLPVYAYHFDAAAAAQFLAANCIRQGVRWIEATVAGTERDGTGRITKLVLEDGRRVEGSFFFDCSGFRRVLIQEAMRARWFSWRKQLPVDSAVVFTLPHDPEADLPLVTLAQALGSGWLWQIPTQDRLGCGYVFTSEFLSPDDAKAEADQVLRTWAKPCRLIRFESGRLDRVWIGNCVATGLAAAFAEPLEATSIHSTLIQLLLLCRHHLPAAMAEPGDPRPAQTYNQRVAAMYDDLRDFLVLHYCTERRDTPFWRAVTSAPLPEALAERLDLWRTAFPDPRHFADSSGAVSPTLYLPVLDGLGYLDGSAAWRAVADSRLESFADDAWRGVDSLFREAVDLSLPHRSALAVMTGAVPCTALDSGKTNRQGGSRDGDQSWR